MDVCIVTGFSLSVCKAELCQIAVTFLGEVVGRLGMTAAEDKVSAIAQSWHEDEFTGPRILRQFLGTTNWVRHHAGAEYSIPVKTLTKYLSKGFAWPKSGLLEDGKIAIWCIKELVKRHIVLSVLDEFAALFVSRLLEQIAGCAKIGWGGVVYQVSADFVKLNVLAQHSGALTDMQALWHPLSQELHAQRMKRKAARRDVGRVPAICWTDHANVVRLVDASDIEPKH